MPESAREEFPPAVVDGALVRLADDGTWVWVEQWVGTGWERTTSTWIDEVMKGPTASPATLKKFNYPIPECGSLFAPAGSLPITRKCSRLYLCECLSAPRWHLAHSRGPRVTRT
jgi:hypothetical protein